MRLASYSIRVNPMGKPRMTQRDKWKQRPAVERYHEFKDTVRAQLPPGFTLPAQFNITFFIGMPRSWSNKQRSAKVGSFHDGKPDIDNLLKAFMDVFPEDKHVGSVMAEKYWSETGSIDIELEEAA